MNESLHFLYHELRPEKSRYTYVVACEEFAAQCALYAQLRKESPSELLRPELTFDDGHESDATYALPVLERFGLRATFFITAGWTGERAGFMDWAQLRSLLSAGQRIGAHGMTHQLLTGCSAKELDRELRGARERLEDGLGAPVDRMSLPGGRANSRVLRACEEAGYAQVFTSEPRAEWMESAPKTVGRLNLQGGIAIEWLERVLDPRSGALGKLQRTDRAKSFAKRVLGDRVYAGLWALGNRQEAEADDAGVTNP